MLNPLSGSVQAAPGNAAAPASNSPSKGAPAPGVNAVSQGPSPARDAVENAVGKLNENPQFTAQGLRFSIDEESGKTVVKIVDTSTQEVLRQFPSAEALALAHSIDKMQGLLLREKA